MDSEPAGAAAAGGRTGALVGVRAGLKELAMENRLRWGRLPSFLAMALVAFAAGRAAWAQSDDTGARVYQRLLKSTVWVVSPHGDGKVSTGSGSLLDQNHRLILTNYHVVADRDRVSVFFPSYQRPPGGKPEIVAERKFYFDLLRKGLGLHGKVLLRDRQRDLAIIQLDAVPEGAVPIRLARDTVTPGQRVHSVGHPGVSGGMWLYTPGTVRQVYHKTWKARVGEGILEFDAHVIETDSPTNPGDSGGPLANDRGELVGVTQGGTTNAQLLSTFIEVREVRAVLNRLSKARGIKVLPPAVASVPPPSPTPADGSKAKPAEGADSTAERDAARKLYYAKKFADDGLVDHAKARYQEIIDQFPKTKAAEEARHQLEKISK
jgi:S1-C subfamily serine protease